MRLLQGWRFIKEQRVLNTPEVVWRDPSMQSEEAVAGEETIINRERICNAEFDLSPALLKLWFFNSLLPCFCLPGRVYCKEISIPVGLR